jgi:hypothetical protein
MSQIITGNIKIEETVTNPNFYGDDWGIGVKYQKRILKDTVVENVTTG